MLANRTMSRWTARGRWLGRLATVVGVCLAAGPEAHAYPQWQFSTGATRCNQCHYAPSGGGLLNDYGRDASGEELSTWEGNGAFLHGAVELPAFLRLGADVRFALASNDNGGPDQPKAAAFPMQFDLHLRLAYKSVAFQAIGGVRGQVRRTDAPIPGGNFQPENANRLVSREHWAAWQPAAQGIYARAGRFFTPFGLRLAEHLVYIRRDLGFNTLDETYNASVGYLTNRWEGHLSVFGPDVLQSGGQEKGVAAYGELRFFEERAAVALQTRYAGLDASSRWIGGAVGKLFVEPLGILLMSEANYVRQMPEGTDGVGQFVGLFGASWLPPVKGVIFTLWAERFQGALGVLDTSSNAFTGLGSWFPFPHFEFQLVGRVQDADGATNIKTFLAQLHYYL
jgi:hypothetical protein